MNIVILFLMAALVVGFAFTMIRPGTRTLFDSLILLVLLFLLIYQIGGVL